MKQLRIAIPEPCTQTWEGMVPTEKGRYCSSCQKEVIDFRSWTADELQDWFLNHKAVCGLFLQEQVVVDGMPMKPSRWNLTKGLFVASCLALFTSSKVYSKQATVTVYEENKDSKSSFTAKDAVADTIVTISGRVKDFGDKIDLVNVKVRTYNGQSTVTNAYGKFTMRARVEKGESIVLAFDYIGYRTKELVLTPGKTEELKIELGNLEEQRMLVLGGAVPVGVMRCVDVRPSFFRQIWNFIKSPFK